MISESNFEWRNRSNFSERKGEKVLSVNEQKVSVF